MTTDRDERAARSPWLPEDFEHPLRVDVDDAHHLRPIEPEDAPPDFDAVMGSRDRLWERYGKRFGWPRADMTLEEDRVDLARHAREAAAHESFNYVLLDARESRVLGCVYIDPSTSADHDAEVSWWLVDDEARGPLRAVVDGFVPVWIESRWPFRRPLLDPEPG